MTHPTPSPADLTRKLAHELTVLRDALVTLSISLKDWQFEMDSQARRQAQQEAAQALAACRAASAPCANKPGPR